MFLVGNGGDVGDSGETRWQQREASGAVWVKKEAVKAVTELPSLPAASAFLHAAAPRAAGVARPTEASHSVIRPVNHATARNQPCDQPPQTAIRPPTEDTRASPPMSWSAMASKGSVRAAATSAFLQEAHVESKPSQQGQDVGGGKGGDRLDAGRPDGLGSPSPGRTLADGAYGGKSGHAADVAGFGREKEAAVGLDLCKGENGLGLELSKGGTAEGGTGQGAIPSQVPDNGRGEGQRHAQSHCPDPLPGHRLGARPGRGHEALMPPPGRSLPLDPALRPALAGRRSASGPTEPLGMPGGARTAQAAAAAADQWGYAAARSDMSVEWVGWGSERPDMRS